MAKRKKAVRKKRGPAKSGRKPIRVAIVGCGSMGRHHARNLLDIPEVEVVALCDVVKSKMQAYGKEFFAPEGLSPSTYTDYDRMLKAESLDAVSLVTPHTLHYPQAKAALTAGLHVLSEKPMVTCSEHARELVALADQKERRLAIALQATVSREFAYIRNLIRRGDLGEIHFVRAHLGQNWLEPLAGTWRHDPKQSGGGELYDSGAHMLNAILWLLDEPVERVFAMIDNRGARVDINSAVSLRFKNGCLASLACVGDTPVGSDADMMLYGTKATIRTGAWGDVLEHYDEAGQRVRYPYVPYQPLTPQRNFVDAILGHDELRCPGRYGILLSELMESVYESAETGQAVMVRHRRKPNPNAA